MDRARRDRLRWKCRRGLLELDLVLERFLRRHVATLSDEELALLGELLDYADNDLWGVVSGRSNRFDPRHGGVVLLLRAA
ncbi:MAG: succinate dehydrogenase assembly factor 2 [Burkholderiales bacterium]|nr:succinate dehydrogenase assembly factor 2 [Burkholderiales bacterium]